MHTLKEILASVAVGFVVGSLVVPFESEAQNRSVTFDATTAAWESINLAQLPDGGVTVIACGSIDLSDGTQARKCSDNINRNGLAATLQPLGNGLVRRAFQVGDGGL